MLLECNYLDLTATLTDLYTVAEDPLSGEDVRNIIFQMSPSGSVTAIACSTQIVIKKSLPTGTYTLSLTEGDTLVDDFFYISLKSKELREYLNSYKSVRTTVVDKITFETAERNTIRCTVYESAKLSAEERTMYENSGEPIPSYRSHWSFNNVPIKQNMFVFIKLDGVGVNPVAFPVENILWHMRNMLPIIQGGVDLFSSLMFDKENVVAMSSTFTTIMPNKLLEGDIFTDIRLTHKCIDFLDKLAHMCYMQECGSLEIGKLERYLYIKSFDSEVFLTYDSKLANYKSVVELFKKDSVVTFDRIYLKDVLKRLSLVNDNIEVSVKADMNVVTLRNTKFTQDIPINFQRGMDTIGNVNFKIMPNVLNGAIIGSDEELTHNGQEGFTDTFVYMTPIQRGLAISFADGTGDWYSTVRVNTY